MTRTTVTALALLFTPMLVTTPLALADGDAAAPPCRVLIVTGEDYEGHLWPETAPALAEAIVGDARLDVTVTEDLTDLGLESLHDYDAVVLHFKNYDPAVPGREAFDNLCRFVDGGGGLVLVHFACGAFEEFRGEFAELAGRVWFGATPPEGGRQHDPHGPFTVTMGPETHPITDGMEPFETTDELYTCLEGDTPITVVAEAVSPVDGVAYPMAFVLAYGDGRVFHCVLGHDSPSLRVPGVAELFRRGTAWAAGLEPTMTADEEG